jgi:hypothetical protein
VPGGSGASSSQQPQPCEAPAITPRGQKPGRMWASTGMAMWREIGSGFISLPDFRSPRMQKGGREMRAASGTLARNHRSAI